VAIKKVSNALPEASAGGAPDWDPTVYFQREVELLQAVRHPNVLRFRVRQWTAYRRPAVHAVNDTVSILASRTVCRGWAT